jgi:hypothetical protein
MINRRTDGVVRLLYLLVAGIISNLLIIGGAHLQYVCNQ